MNLGKTVAFNRPHKRYIEDDGHALSIASALGAEAPRDALRLERAERVEVVTEKRPTLADDEHAHNVEPNPDFLGVQVLDEVGSREPFERRAVRVLLGKSLAAVLCDLAVDEDQVVLVTGDEVDDVAADSIRKIGVSGARGTLEVLFRYERELSLIPVVTEDGVAIAPDPKKEGSQKTVQTLKAWKRMRDQLASGEIDEGDYESWKARFMG